MLDLNYDEIKSAGYSYDPAQDIFFSTKDAWQRNYGYCRMYDEAAAPLGMIIDCEPVYFNYEGKNWLIEFWKGQYDLTTGSEVGIYTTTGSDLNIPGIFNFTFYNCALDEDLLLISYILKKNDKPLFKREDKHWWLTGFKLGEFSEPDELIMEVNINFKNKKMRNAFWIGLNNAGYQDSEIYLNKYTLGFLYDKPRTQQPISRIPATDWIIQRKNQKLCTDFSNLTNSTGDMQEKLNTIKQNNPKMYEEILNMGKCKALFRHYDIIKNLNGVQ